MRFTIEHPQDSTCCATYGWDRALGFFVDIRPSRPLGTARVEYDATQDNYRHQRPLRGALDLLVQHGFIARDDLDQAFSLMQQLDPEQLEPAVGRCAQLLANFKAAAA